MERGLRVSCRSIVACILAAQEICANGAKPRSLACCREGDGRQGRQGRGARPAQGQDHRLRRPPQLPAAEAAAASGNPPSPHPLSSSRGVRLVKPSAGTGGSASGTPIMAAVSCDPVDSVRSTAERSPCARRRGRHRRERAPSGAAGLPLSAQTSSKICLPRSNGRQNLRGRERAPAVPARRASPRRRLGRTEQAEFANK